jgi:hypothetical protein
LSPYVIAVVLVLAVLFLLLSLASILIDATGLDALELFPAQDEDPATLIRS